MIELPFREGRELKRKKKAPPSGGKEGKRQKVNLGGNQTAMEAIEKMAQEKISTKINYDVLRSLNMDTTAAAAAPSTPTAARTADLPLTPVTPGAAAGVTTVLLS